jgi:hypothetical protein
MDRSFDRRTKANPAMNPFRILGTLLIMGITGFFFFKRMFKLWTYMKAAKPDGNRLDHPLRRLGDMALYGLAQKRMFNRLYGGLLHVMIFWGFCVLVIANTTLIVRGFAGPEFSFPLLGENDSLGQVYNGIKEIFTVLVLVSTADSSGGPVSRSRPPRPTLS